MLQQLSICTVIEISRERNGGIIFGLSSYLLVLSKMSWHFLYSEFLTRPSTLLIVSLEEKTLVVVEHTVCLQERLRFLLIFCYI